METNRLQREAAHELGEAVLRLLVAMSIDPQARTAAESKEPKVPRDQRLLRAAEVAEILAIGKSMVYALMSAGKLPSIRIGSARRFRLSDVLLLAENGVEQ